MVGTREDFEIGREALISTLPPGFDAGASVRTDGSGHRHQGVQPLLLAGLDETHENHPFERPGLFRRVLPFALVSVLAEASLALSSRSESTVSVSLSVGFLCAVAGLMCLPWHRAPKWLTVTVPIFDVAFVLMLILASGYSASGVGIVILVPLIWTALYHRRWESFVVVGSIVLVEIVISLYPMRVTDVVLLRRIVFWTALGLLLSVATHTLRDRLRRLLEQRETSLRRTVEFAAATEELTTLLDPDEVLTVAVRLAAELVSPSGTSGRRAQYNRIVGEMIHVVAQFDETGQTITEPFPLVEQPNIVEVLQWGVTIQRPLSLALAGPAVRSLISALGVTNSVYIPVHHAGQIDGVLSVPMRGSVITPDLVEFCSAFGHLVELSLRNAYVYKALQEEATTDDLTGLPNRRAFDRVISNRPGRMKFSIMAIDLDGLKHVNDTMGHVVGDEMLAHAAGAMQSALRQGDVVARMGGDEFAVFLFDADSADAAIVGERILATMDKCPPNAAVPSVSIGIATGDSSSDPFEIMGAADKAMYRAKSGGGGQSAFS